jgi:ribosome production factor 2
MKKRPHHLVFGRTFNYQLLDMIEFGIKNYVPASEFKVRYTPASTFVQLFFP